MQLVTTRPEWFSPQDMRLMNQAFKFAVKQFGLEGHHEAVQLRFNRYLNNDGADGMVDNLSRDPICMSLGRLPLLRTISALFHEMTHVKQRVKGELEVSESERRIRFQGRYFYSRDIPHSHENDEDIQKYKNLPWEKEAFAMQSKLLREFSHVVSRTDHQYILNTTRGFV